MEGDDVEFFGWLLEKRADGAGYELIAGAVESIASEVVTRRDFGVDGICSNVPRESCVKVRVKA
jgi:hypothetical protein